MGCFIAFVIPPILTFQIARRKNWNANYLSLTGLLLGWIIPIYLHLKPKNHELLYKKRFILLLGTMYFLLVFGFILDITVLK